MGFLWWHPLPELLASAPNHSEQLKWRSELVLFVASGHRQKPPASLSPITPLYLNLKRIQRVKKAQFTHTWSPQRLQMIFILHLSSHPDLKEGGWWREISRKGSWAGSHITMQFSVFTIPRMHFRGNQSVREIEDPLETSLWFSFPHF